MRLKRHKICVDDFDLLTIIGRGAFGEVQICTPLLDNYLFLLCFLSLLIFLLIYIPKNKTLLIWK